jgi:hypothetical protein
MIGLMNVDPEPLSLREPLLHPPQPIRSKHANPTANPLPNRSTAVLLDGFDLSFIRDCSSFIRVGTESREEQMKLP